VLLPGLGAHGLWTEGELAVLARVRAALGEPLHGLVRSPWLPDALRNTAARLMGPSDLAVRLPGALAVCGLVTLAAVEAHRRFRSTVSAGIAGILALALPWSLAGGRTALGAPVAELFVAVAVVAALRGLRTPSQGEGDFEDEPRGIKLLSLGVAAVSVVAAVASAGLFVGGTLPLAVLALTLATDEKASKRGLGVGLWMATGSSLVVCVWLSAGQDNGYIPLLGASRSLELMDQPHLRPFTATLEEVGLGLFPWLGLIVVGAFSPGSRLRFASVWLLVAVVGTTAWSMRYGPSAVGVTVPAALCAARGVERLCSPREGRTQRRLWFALVCLCVLILGKDAERQPEVLVVPVADLEAGVFPEHLAPAETDAGAGSSPPPDRRTMGDATHRWSRIVLGMLALAFFLSPASRTSEDERPIYDWRGRLPDQLGPMLIVGLAAAQAVVGAQRLSPRLDAQLSMRPPLDRWTALVDADLAPPTLGIHRVDDDAVRWYAGDRVEQLQPLASRRDIFEWFDRPDPAVALIPAKEFPPVFSRQRLKQSPLYVLDRRAEHTWLVANFLPEGARDQNPILDVLSDEAPGTGHPTYVRFKNYVEVVEWDLLGDPRRGGEVELVVTFKVLRPLPSSTQLWGRLKMDRLSRVNDEPQVLTGGVYPPNNWRRGDYVTHRATFEIPRLEAFPGPHEVLIGLRRNQYDNVEITLPEGKRGEYGVRVIGNKRGFARVGEVEVR